MIPTPVELASTVIFTLAILHTFFTKYFEHLARIQPSHAGIWHLLGEIEIVFGFWAMIFIIFFALYEGTPAATHYLEQLSYTQPLFVFVTMVIAASKPILEYANKIIVTLTHWLPIQRTAAFYMVALTLTPLLGSLITGPAAMTLAALMLREHLFSKNISYRFKYLTLGVLFVNISIGSMLTTFAAPPILMVADKWGWNMPLLLTTFGWKAILAMFINAGLSAFWFRSELKRITLTNLHIKRTIPRLLLLTHMACLAGVIYFGQHPIIFIGLFMFFLGVTQAYPQHQHRLILREGLLIAFFLAGLMILGTQQHWWLQSILPGMNPTLVYFCATALTAVVDNAALTYLGSLVEGITPAFQYALIAGAMTGGGLTVIANAPNPVGFSILKHHFDEGSISPLKLFVAAIPPTMVAILAFQLL